MTQSALLTDGHPAREVGPSSQAHLQCWLKTKHLTATEASTLGAGFPYFLSWLCTSSHQLGWPQESSFSWLSSCSPSWLLPRGLLGSTGFQGCKSPSGKDCNLRSQQEAPAPRMAPTYLPSAPSNSISHHSDLRAPWQRLAAPSALVEG